MGWKDLFKSKGTKNKPDPRIRWFGKLPTYADYYSSATDADWVVEFNDWLLKGCEQYYSRGRQAGVAPRVPSSAVVLRLPKAQMTVLASVQDYGGDMRGRPFPLAFYVGVPTEMWPGPTGDGITGALRVLRQLTDLRQDVYRFCNAPGRFDAVFGSRDLDVSGVDGEVADQSWRQAAQSLPAVDWFGAARSCLGTDDPDLWFSLVAEWGGNIAKLEGDEFGPTLRFPLVMDIAFEPQIGGWLAWLGRRMDVAHRYLSLLIAKDVAGGTGRLSVVARDVVPEDFLLLTVVANTLPYVDDVCALRVPQVAADGGSGAGPPPEPSMRAPDSWAAFVESEITA